MGCWYSRLIDGEEMVSRCKARKRYMKQFVKARHAFSAAHSMQLRSLRNTGSALLQFAIAESNLHHNLNHNHNHHHLPPLPPSPPPPHPNPPPPMSPVSWTTTTTSTASAIHPPPPPPPPPPVPSSSTWDFWDPFMPTSGRSIDEEEWEEETATMSEVAPTTTTAAGKRSVTAPASVVTATATSASSELAVVVSTKSKDLVEIIQELDDYFLKAASAGGPLSVLLEVPTCGFNRQGLSGVDYGHGKSSGPLMWTWSSSSTKWNAFGKFCEDPVGNNNVGPMGANGLPTHCSTVERLYAWEKKLYQEVKNAEYLKLEHDKKAATLRKLEMKNADYFKTEKAKKEVEKLESQMLVAAQTIETTSTEIIKLRESQLYPQLLELVDGLMNMWRSMYEFHQVQTHIVQQLKYLNFIPSTNPTSEIHRQSTLQLELEAQQWHESFCNLIKAQRDYIQSLTGWLRLSLFQIGNNSSYSVHKTMQDSAIYSLCEEWQHAINNAPDKVASEGIKSLLTMIHAIVVQQSEEQKQKKRSESVFKELEKKATELRALERKYGPYEASSETNSKNPVREKRAKVESLRAKAQDEKAKYEKSVSVTRAMTMNNLQMGLPHVFQAMTGFANVCRQAFESVHSQAKSNNDLHNAKMLLH